MTWDLFLAHATADADAAQVLYDAFVAVGWRVFFDRVTLLPGDVWVREIPRAQRASRITVACWSRRADPAWYLQDEVQSAVALTREPGAEHRLVVIYLDGRPGPGDDPFYGTRIVHGLDLLELGVAGVVAQLARVLPLAAGVVPLPIVDHRGLYDALCDLLPGPFDQLVQVELSALRDHVAERGSRHIRALHVINAAHLVGGEAGVRAAIRRVQEA